MKKKIIIGAISLLVSIVGFITTFGALDKSYELVSDDFITEVAVNDKLNYQDMYIIETNMYGSKNIIVSDEMIVDGKDTSTVGKKTLLIEYNDVQFSVEYTVKYKVQFIVEDEVVSTQLVNDRGELIVPADPHKEANEFLGWIPAIPAEITENIIFEANFTDKPLEVPTLTRKEATYGDTLGTIELPSNQYGEWKFVDSLDTLVGNAGKNEFAVQFWPTNTELAKIDDKVVINVAKKELTFKNLVTEFEYDGTAKVPTYDLDVEVNVKYFGPNPTEIGEYLFTLEVVDDNYKGYLASSFKITKPVVYVVVENLEMVLGGVMPEIKYSIEGNVDANELGIKVIKPSIMHAGEYPLTISWTNTNYNVKVSEGVLTVHKADMTVIDPSFTTEAVFDSKLSTVLFENINPSGTWSWKNPNEVISEPTSYTATAVFTPNDSADYNIIERDLTFKVEKKVLTLVLDGEGNSANTFDYDGTAKNIKVRIADGSYPDVEIVIEYSDTTIISHPVNAGNYYCTAKIVDERYRGSLSANLVINKIDPTLLEGEFFSESYSANWNTSLRDIQLPIGYTWDEPDTLLSSVGTQQFAATYTPEDTVNYNCLYGKFTVTVNKLEGIIRGVAENYIKNYNGSVHTLTGIYANHNETEITFEYKLNGVVVESLLNAGEYTVTIKLAESDHYLACETQTTVTITQSNVALPDDFIATYEDTLGLLVLPTSDYGKWSWKTGDDTLVGDVNDTPNVHVAVFTSTNPNYSSFEHGVNVTVKAKELFIELVQDTFEYDGENHAVIYKLIDENGKEYSNSSITVKGSDTSLKEYGEKTFVLEVNEKNYFSSQKLVTLKVTKVQIEKPVEPSVTTFQYTGSEQIYSIAENALYKVTNNKQTNAGTYTVYVELVDTKNYCWNGGTTSRLTFTFVIDKVDYQIDLPTNLTAVYGDVLGNVALPESEEGVWKWNDRTLSVGNAGTNLFEATFYVNEEEGIDNYNDTVYAITLNVGKKVVFNPGDIADRVYTGSDLKPSISIPDEYKDIYELTQNLEAINVGTYSVIYTLIDSANYKWETSEEASYVVQYDIAKAQSKIDSLTIEGWVYLDTPNTPVINGVFIENVVFTYSNDEVNFYTLEQMVFGAGRYFVKATVSETENYYGCEKVVEFSVAKKVVIAPTIDSVVYDGSLHNAIIELSELYTVKENNGGIQIGEYLVILTLVDSSNYKWSTTNEEDLTLNFVIIANTNNEWTVSPTVEAEYVFGKFTSIGTASALFGDVIIEYKSITADEYTTVMPTEVGRYIIRFRVEDTLDYNGLAPVEFTFAIVKDQVELPIVNEEVEFIYNGSEQEFIVPESIFYSVSGNVQTNAGSYTVVVSLNNSNGYEWADGTTNDLKYTFVILKQVVTAPSDKSVVYTGEEFTDGIQLSTLYTFESISETNVGVYYIDVTLVDPSNYTWDMTTSSVYTVTLSITTATTEIKDFSVSDVTYGELFAPTATSNFGTVEFLYSTTRNGEYTDEVPQTAGQYYVKAVVADTNNYTSASTEALVANILKQKIELPEADNSEFYYTGSELTYVIADSEYYTVSNNKHTLADTYAVSVELVDPTNYAWSTDSSAALSYEFTIKQAANEWEVAPTITGWTYNEDAVNGTAKAKFGKVVVEYKQANASDSTYTKSLPTEAGLYTVRFTVAETTDYAGLESKIEFTVEKASVETPEIASVIYNKEVQVATVSESYLYVVTENNGGINVGTYDVVLTLTDESNYKWVGSETASIVLEFVVEKACAEVTNLTIEGWSYLSEANTPSAETTFGTIVYSYIVNDVEQDEVPTLPGTYKVKATVNDNDNFDGDSMEVEFTITKFDVSIPSIESLSYTGETLTSGLTDNEYYTVVDNGGIDKGEYFAVLTLTNTDLYQWVNNPSASSVQVKYNIVAEQNIWTVEPTITSEVVYGETFTATAASKFGEVVIEYKLVDAEDSTYTEVLPTIAGIYNVRFSVAADDAGSYGALLVYKTLTIKKAQVSVPLEDQTSYSYTGQPITYNVELNDNYTVTGNVQTNANETGYTVTVTLNDITNYEWNDGSVSDKTYTFIINKAHYTPVGIISATAVYGQKLTDITISYTNTDGTWSWVDADTLVGNAGTNVHKAIFTPSNENYLVSEHDINVSVSQAVNEFTTALTINGWTYGETPNVPMSAAKFGEVVYTYSSDNVNYYTLEEMKFTAGTYYVKAVIAETTNFTGLEVVETFVVEKANPVVTWPTNLSAEWGQSLSSISLGERFTWEKDITLPKTIGTYSYKMVYTPEDELNYNVISQNIAVTIVKKAVTINVENTQFEYFVGNTGFELGISHNNSDSSAVLDVTYEYSSTLDGQYVEHIGAIINAGYYKVIINMNETYYYYGLELEEIVVVEKAKELIFDETTAEYNDTVESYLPTSNYGEWTAVIKQEVSVMSSETIINNLGRITLLATFTPYDEYAANFAKFTKEIYLNVEARTLTIEVTENSFVYNTEKQVLKYNVYDNGQLVDMTTYGITIAGNTGLTNVSSQEFTLTVSGNELYRGSVTSTLTITKATVTVPTISNKVYNKNTQTADITTSDLYEITENNGGVNAGEYNVILTLKDHENYKWSTATESNDVASVELKFVIEKATFDMTGVAWNYTSDLSYTGEAQTVLLTNLPSDLKVSYTGNTQTVVGNYTAVATFTYDTDNYNSVSVDSLSWSIVEGNVEITGLQLSSWTYGDTPNVAEANTNFGTIAFTYSTNRESGYSSTIPTEAGTYYVKASVAGTVNYNGNEAILEFTINKKNVTIEWTYDESYTYTGSAFDIPTAKVVKVGSNNPITLTVTEENSKAFRNVDDYKFIATLDADLINNYNVENTYVEIKVSKADAEFEYDTAYNTTWNSDLVLDDLSISTISLGSVTFVGKWKEPSTSLNVGENQEYIIVYTPSDTSNYNTKEVIVYVNIQRATSTINSEDSYTHYYNATPFTFTATSNNTEAEVQYKYVLNGEEVESILGIGTYTVTVTVAQTEHYSSASKTVTVTVNKGTITDYEKPSFTTTVLTTLNDITLPTELAGQSGTFEWMDGNNLIADLTQVKFSSAGEVDNYNLIFKPNDTNYNNVTIESVVITVERIQTTVDYSDVYKNQVLRYTGSQFNAETMATWFKTNSTASITATFASGINLKGESVNIMKDAGTYQIQVIISQSDLYTACTVTLPVTVERGLISPTGTASAVATYGETLSMVSISYTGFDGRYSWVDGSLFVGNVGTNSFDATFTPSDEYNYLAAETSYKVSVVVEKATTEILTFTVANKNYTQDAISTAQATSNVGTVTFLYATSFDATGSEWTTEIPKNVGTYYVKAIVEGTENYSDAIYNGGEIKSYIISKTTPNLNVGTIPDLYEDRLDEVNFNEFIFSVEPNTSKAVAGTFSFVTKPVFETGTSNVTQFSTTVTFKPNDTANYESTSTEITGNLSAVAKDGNGTYYGTIEKALNAVSSGTVYVIPGTNPVITSSVSIKKDVTLSIPYGVNSDGTYLEKDRYGTNFDFADASDENIQLYRKNNVSVKSKDETMVVITVEEGATLIIGGIIGAGQSQRLQGMTSGDYTQITLYANTKIVSNGTIECYGYIKEGTNDDNGSLVELVSGKLTMPYVVYDFRGGTNTVTVYRKGNIFPFSVMDMPNIQSKLKVHADATVEGTVGLYASNSHQHDVINVYANAGAMINIATGGYIELKYTPETFGYTKLSDVGGITTIKMYGGGSVSAMELEVQGVTVSGANILFPVSWKLQFELYNGEYSIAYKYKFLTGSSLLVGETATLNITGEVIFYQNFNDVEFALLTYPQKEAAQLIVKGTLNITGKFAGLITCETSGAMLYIADSASTTITSIEGNSGTTQPYEALANLGEFIVTNSITEYSQGYTLESNYVSNFAPGTYYSQGNKWYSNNICIYYNANGGSLTANSDGTTTTFEGEYHPGATGFLIESISALNPTRDRYTFAPLVDATFDGWYLDPECKRPAIGSTIFTSVTVYAKWIADEYEINYSYVFDDCEETTVDNTMNSSFYTVESAIKLNDPIAGNLVFGGWFSDASCSTPIDTIYGKEYTDEITIYGKWYSSDVTPYTVVYQTNNTDFTLPNGKIFDSDTGAYLLPNFDIQNNDRKYTQYFLGWYDNEGNKLTVEDIRNNIADLAKENNTLYLYGQWTNKYCVTIMQNGLVNYYHVYNQSITLPALSSGWDASAGDYIAHNQEKWSIGGKNYNGGVEFTATESVTATIVTETTKYYKTTLTAYYSKIELTFTNGYAILMNDKTLRSSYVYENTEKDNKSTDIYLLEGTTISFKFSYKNSEYNGYEISNSNGVVVTDTYDDGGGWFSKYKGTPANPSNHTTIASTYSIIVSSGNKDGACIFGDSMVLMADGTYKLAKDIKLGDKVLTWSFEEGKYVATQVIFYETIETFTHKVTLYFNDGTEFEFAYGQSFFDVDSKKYVSINADNVSDYVGMNLFTYDNGSIGTKQIIGYNVEFICEEVYEIITAKEYSFICDNILTMEPFVLYMLPFEVGDNFKYDQEAMQKDIETYGLFTYDEWKEYVTEEQFEFFNGQYIKVAIAKGYYSTEYLIEIILRYVVPENMG